MPKKDKKDKKSKLPNTFKILGGQDLEESKPTNTVLDLLSTTDTSDILNSNPQEDFQKEENNQQLFSTSTPITKSDINNSQKVFQKTENNQQLFSTSTPITKSDINNSPEAFQKTENNQQLFSTSTPITKSDKKDKKGKKKDKKEKKKEKKKSKDKSKRKSAKSNSENRSWYEMLSDTQHWTAFPFTIGIEMELIICNNDGEYISGDDMVFRMSEITREAVKLMNQLINYELDDPNFPPMPEYIRNKLGKIAYSDTDEEKGLTMNLYYRIGESKDYVTIQSFGRDGNVTAITYLLELVTPVCSYVEELAYWSSILFNLAKKTLPKDLNLVASAINPASKEYNRGLSQGDHNHIGGFRSDKERAQIYDMIRNFIPHIIGLSVNSPIINNRPTDVIKTKIDPVSGKPRYVAPNCIRSIRLYNNNTMLSSNDPKHFIPYLPRWDENDKKRLLQVLQKMDLYDARYQDVFPQTDFNTIEIRVMDAQLSICRRIGLAMLNEALCYKARKLLEKGRIIPDVGSETLTFNRKGAIERGLISIFKNVNSNRDQMNKYDPRFADYYFGPKDRPYRFLFESVQGMFHYIKDELKELGYLNSPFLKPVLQSIFGSISYAETPMTEADYQLSLYDYKLHNGENPNILEDLIYFTDEYSKDPLNNPLTGTLTLPNSMKK